MVKIDKKTDLYIWEDKEKGGEDWCWSWRSDWGKKCVDYWKGKWIGGWDWFGKVIYLN